MMMSDSDEDGDDDDGDGDDDDDDDGDGDDIESPPALLVFQQIVQLLAVHLDTVKSKSAKQFQLSSPYRQGQIRKRKRVNKKNWPHHMKRKGLDPISP